MIAMMIMMIMMMTVMMIESIKTTSMENVSSGVHDKNKEHYLKCKGKA